MNFPESHGNKILDHGVCNLLKRVNMKRFIHSLEHGTHTIHFEELFRKDIETHNIHGFEFHSRLFNYHIKTNLYGSRATYTVIYTNVWFDEIL